jgi:branched-chain amino acid transport system substrate-binding protein
MRFSRKLLAVALVLGLVAAACGDDKKSGDASSGATNTTPAETVNIGELASLTGLGSEPWGIPVDAGLKLALDDIASSGFLKTENVKFALKAEDDATEPTKAVTLFNEFTRQATPVVISSAYTPIAAAVSPLATDSKVLFIAVGSGGTGKDDPDYFFRMNDAIGPMETLGKYLVTDKGVKRPVAIIDGDNAAFGPIAANIERGIKAAGLATGFVDKQTISTKDTDFSSVLTNLRRANPDVVYFSVTPAQSGNILRQMAQFGGFDNVPKAGHIGWSKQVSDVAGPAATGAVFAQPWAPGAAGSEKFAAAYTKKYNSAPTAYSALGYDTGWLLATAVKMAKAKGQKIDGTVLKDLLPLAAAAKDYTDHALVKGMALPDTGRPSYPGVLATFAADGSVKAL